MTVLNEAMKMIAEHRRANIARPHEIKMNGVTLSRIVTATCLDQNDPPHEPFWDGPSNTFAGIPIVLDAELADGVVAVPA